MDKLGSNPENEIKPDYENSDFQEQKHKIEPLISPVAAAVIGLVGGFILYQFVGGAITLLIFGLDLETAPVNGMRFMAVAGQLLFILLPALLFTKWIYRDITSIILTKLPKFREFLLFTIGMIILIPMLQSYLYVQNYFVEYLAANSEFIGSLKSILDSLNEMIEKTYGNLLRADNIPEMILVMITIAVVPAICEEVMFRGYIQRSFEFKITPFRAAVVTAAFFSLYHFNPYGLIPLFLLGFYFGFAAYISKSIVLPIYLHFLNNFSAVFLFFVLDDQEIISSSATDPEGLTANIVFFFSLLLIFLIVIFYIRNGYKKTKTN